MVLPSTGGLSLSSIQTEFGGASPASMSEYYTNANPIYTNGVPGIPAINSSISFSMFYGKTRPIFGLLSNATVNSKVVIYGMKLYRTEYTGPIIKVRRSTDNILQDFYATTTGTITTSANGGGTSYATWLGSATGYVTVWYDQSGNGSNVVQNTNSMQPTLTTAGKLVFNGSTQFLEKAYNSDVNTTNFTYIVSCKCYSPNDSYYQSPITTRGLGTGFTLYKMPDNYFYHWNGVGNGGWETMSTGVTCVANTVYNIAGQYNGSTINTIVNGTTASSSMAITLNTTHPFRIGAGATESTTGYFFWNGEISTVMYFNTVISTTDRDTILANTA